MSARWIVVGGLWVLTAVAVVTGWSFLVLSGELLDTSGGQAVFVTLTGCCAPIVATVMLRRHPNEWTGPLLGAMVIAGMIAMCRSGPLGIFAEFAGLVMLVTVLVPAVVALDYAGFPEQSVSLRPLIWCCSLSAAIGGLIWVLGATGNSVPGHWWYTEHPGPATALAMLLLAVYVILVSAGAVFTLVIAGRRYRLMPIGGRSALRPVMVPLVGWALATLSATWWALAGTVSDAAVRVGQQPSNPIYTVLPALLVVILAAGICWIDVMVRRPAGRSGTAPPSFSRSDTPRVTAVEDYLARALADPSIRVLYPVGRHAGDVAPQWIDSKGGAVTIDDPKPDRATTLIRRGATQIGLIEHDAAVSAKPDAVELVATGAGLIMEIERLTAAAQSDLERSRRLATRLLAATDEPRADLRAMMLAGPLKELAAISADLTAGSPLSGVIPRLNRAAADVRAISHGVFPASLTSGGLRAALPGISVPNRRYPGTVEMTAYLAARFDDSALIVETTVNAERWLSILTSRRPPADVRDRVAALGGEIRNSGSGWDIRIPAGPD